MCSSISRLLHGCIGAISFTMYFLYVEAAVCMVAHLQSHLAAKTKTNEFLFQCVNGSVTFNVFRARCRDLEVHVNEFAHFIQEIRHFKIQLSTAFNSSPFQLNETLFIKLCTCVHVFVLFYRMDSFRVLTRYEHTAPAFVLSIKLLCNAMLIVRKCNVFWLLASHNQTEDCEHRHRAFYRNKEGITRTNSVNQEKANISLFSHFVSFGWILVH